MSCFSSKDISWLMMWMILPTFFLSHMMVIQPRMRASSIELTVEVRVKNSTRSLPHVDDLIQHNEQRNNTLPTVEVRVRNTSRSHVNDLIQQNDQSNSTLPTCEELMMQSSSIPFTDGSFLTQKSTPIVWKTRKDGSRELTLPSTCRLKRYTALEAGHCLTNKNILFVGDSLTRYQFLDLAYFIEHKQHPPRFKYSEFCTHVDEHGNETCSSKDNPNPSSNRATYQQLGSKIFRGRMETSSVQARYKIRHKTIVRMQYISSKEDGGTKLTFVQEIGDGGDSLNGWNFTGCASNASCHYTDAQYEANKKKMMQNRFDWKYASISDAFRPNNGTIFYEQYLKDINYAIYNRGVWGLLRLDTAKKMMTSLHRIAVGRNNEDQSSNRCFYKSTTPSRKGDRKTDSWEYGNIRNITHDAGCEYYDIFHLTKEFAKVFSNSSIEKQKNVFVDCCHFQPWVYEELNNMLLNILCNA